MGRYRLFIAVVIAFVLGNASGAQAKPPTVYVPTLVTQYVPILVQVPALAITPEPTIEPTPEPTPEPTQTPRPPSRVVTGVPTWYCLDGVSRCTRNYPDRAGVVDLYAAAGPSMRVGDWRGRLVRVCAEGCITVKLIDWCACGGDHFLDLYWDAWNALGKPHFATVSW